MRKTLIAETRSLLKRGYQAFSSLHFSLFTSGISCSQNYKNIGLLCNKHKGKRCFIIGSGPSIKKMNLPSLKDEITFGFNAFYLISESVGFLPTYYLVEDPLPAEDNSKELNSLKSTTKIFPWDLRKYLKPDESTFYVNFIRYYTDFPSNDFPQFSDNAAKCVYWGGTVAYMALQLALYMGIREVYLIGIDLDYKVPGDVKGNVIVSRNNDVNHFHHDYFGPGKRWHQPRVKRMQRAFEYAFQYYKANGGVIYNATVGGKLETLPRVDYKNIL